MGFFGKSNIDYISDILEKVTTNIERLSKQNIRQMELIEKQQQQINTLVKKIALLEAKIGKKNE